MQHLPRTPFSIPLALALGGLAAALPAQQDRTPPAPDSRKPEAQEPGPIPIPSDGGEREVRRLTLEDALRLGRRFNLGLRADELTPLQLSEDVRIQDAFFEPELFASANYSDSESPRRNFFSPSVTRETVSGSLGLRQRIVTGANWDVTFTPVRVRTQSDPFPGQTEPPFPSEQHTMDIAFRVTQPLLRGAWGASNLAGLRRAEAARTGGQARFERRVQDTLIQIVEAYWELVFAREAYRVTIQALELAQEQLRITNERIRVRELAERDRVFDEADVARRQEELIRAENSILQREDDLRQLLLDNSDGRLWALNIQPTSPIEGDFDVPESDWQAAANAAIELRPDLRALRAEVRSAEIELDRTIRELLPQLDLVGSYASDGARDEFDRALRNAWKQDFPDFSIGLEFSIPIGNTAARATRDRAMLRVEQARRQLHAAELDVTREVRRALRDLSTASQSIAAASESVRLAETQLDTERERLRVGRGTIFEVQQRNQELLDARQQLLRNKIDFRVAESRLLYAQGVLEAPESTADPAPGR